MRRLQHLKTEKLEMATKSTPWSVDEVTTFLHLIADDKIQRELDGTTRNLKVFKEVSALLSVRGYSRTFQQCRDKLKKLKSEYRAIKDHNGRSGSDRRSWKWFDLMDDIYGHRPSSVGREGGLDSATALLESLHGKSLLTLCYLLENVVSLSIIKLTSNKQVYFILTFKFYNPCLYGSPKSYIAS